MSKEKSGNPEAHIETSQSWSADFFPAIRVTNEFVKIIAQNETQYILVKT
jgi:hypothetical protein